MNKLLIVALLTSVSLTSMATGIERVEPNSGGDSFICINDYSQIKTDGYFHYVFPSKIQEGATIQVTDYANDYNKIEVKVVMAGNEGFILASEDESFVLGVNKIEGSGTLDHRGKENYLLSCQLSGPILLE
ncbi:MAG: hypothetical protein A2622_09680 [Bdellovibrionales bacterium RIFCSPHIGHO2_01_FULL_40_29]|nr:MAG: hypothetical protein A2622_09680 [Bdellovibrionales bacterium RIFCSPHIGHO2_01_FULL_40_29]OFZ32479.1 MAG: hypothetical protein A3D17_12985 [Bdellovibrionales bacterium RIFCSPHIGHO2_02_FULL_40_15]